MNAKRFVYACLAILFFALLWNGIVHMVVLREANIVLEKIARPAAERSVVLGLLVTVGIVVLFVYSYSAFVRTAGIRHALVHGAFFGLLAGVLVDLNQFFLYPIPGSLALTWFLFGFVEFCIYGALAAWIYPLGAQPGSQPDATR